MGTEKEMADQKKAEDIVKIQAMRDQLGTLKSSMSDLQVELQTNTEKHQLEVQTMLASIVQAFASVNSNMVAQAEREGAAYREVLEDIEERGEEAALTSWDCLECNYPNTDGLVCAHCGSPHPNPEEAMGNQTLGALMGANFNESGDNDDDAPAQEPAVVGAADQAWRELLARGAGANGEGLVVAGPPAVVDGSDDESVKVTAGMAAASLDDTSSGEEEEVVVFSAKNALFDETKKDEDVISSSSNPLN